MLLLLSPLLLSSSLLLCSRNEGTSYLPSSDEDASPSSAAPSGRTTRVDEDSCHTETYGGRFVGVVAFVS
jgi:hypothetical protein